jgi:hypothetical protein
MKCPMCGSPRFMSRYSDRIDVMFELCCADCSHEWTDPPTEEHKPTLKERWKEIDWQEFLVRAARIWLLGVAITLGIILLMGLIAALIQTIGWNTAWVIVFIIITIIAVVILMRD